MLELLVLDSHLAEHHSIMNSDLIGYEVLEKIETLYFTLIQIFQTQPCQFNIKTLC
jgi:hypothetical protein